MVEQSGSRPAKEFKPAWGRRFITRLRAFLDRELLARNLAPKGSPKTWREQARERLARGDLNGALAVYEQLFAREPTDVSIARTYADLLAKNHPARAVAVCKEAAAQLAADELHERAIGMIRRAISLDPERGELHELLGDYQAARICHIDALLAYQESLERYGAAGAMNDLLRIRERMNKAVSTCLNAARDLVAENSADRAADMLKRVALIVPSHPALFLTLGETELARLAHAAAIAAYRTAAELYDARGEHTAAVAARERIEQITEFFPQARSA